MNNWDALVAERDALKAEVTRLTNDGIHTCHDECPRLPCVLRRERDALQARVDALVEALTDARRIITDIEGYMARPERGDWGVECALCMGELFDDDREAIARIDAILSQDNQS